MAEKMSTLILKVDLDCRQCYKKIRKILCKLQDQERIRTISYDGGSHTIAVAGPFDPHKLSCRIRCMGGKVIKGIDIIVHGHGGDGHGDGGGGGRGGGGGCRPEMMASPPPMKKGKKKQKGKPPKEMEPPPPPAEAAEHQPPQGEEPPQPGHPPDSHIAAAMPAMIEDMKLRERPAELEPPPPANDLYVPAAAPMEQECPRERLPPTPPPAAAKPVWPVDVTTTTTVEIPSWPAQPMPAEGGSCGCSCCPPCYRGYYDGCRCCSCGRVYGYAAGILPPPAGCYGAAGGYRPGCHQLLGEEDPASACTIM